MQSQIMNLLEDHKERTTKEIAKELEANPKAVWGALRRMYQHGEIKRRSIPAGYKRPREDAWSA